MKNKLYLSLLAVLFLSIVDAAIVKADDITDMFAAVDITTLSTSISTLMISVIAISVLFVGFRYVKKTLKSV